jgi:hypothetical protein
LIVYLSGYKLNCGLYRAVAEAFDYAVKYDSKTSTVVLKNESSTSSTNISTGIIIPELNSQPSYKQKALDKLSVKLNDYRLKPVGSLSD